MLLGSKSVAWRYFASSGFRCLWQNAIRHSFWLLFFQGQFPHSSSLFSGPFKYFLHIFFTGIYFLSSVMVHPSSHKTPNYISGDVFTFGQMWICLDCLLIPGICSVAMCEDSIVLPSGSLAVISFYIIKVSIVVVDCFVRCIFSPESTISRMLLLGEFYGVPIQFIKLILGLLTSILFIISPNHHSHPFLFPPSLLL